ncbi:hypothetical protein D3C84_676950 [compost metagenome]
MIRLLLQIEHGSACQSDDTFSATLSFCSSRRVLQHAGLLHFQVTLQIQPSLFFLEEFVTSHVLLVQQALIILRQLRGYRQRFQQIRHLCPSGLDFGAPLKDFRINQLQAAAVLLILPLEPALCRKHLLRIGMLNGTDQGLRVLLVIDCVQHCLATRTVNSRSKKIALDELDVCIRGSRI